MASLADIEEDPFESIGGTEGYMAPEVVAFMVKDLAGIKKLGPRGTASDIWSLGATLHALIFSEAETPYGVTADQQSDGTWYVSMSELSQQAMADALFQRMMQDSSTTEEWEVRSFCDLIAAMLSLDPLSRPTAEDILQHPAVQGVAQDTLKGSSSEAWRKVIQPRIDRALQRQSSMMAQTVAPVLGTDKLAEDTASSSGSETATGSTPTSTSESEPHLRQHKQPDPEYWRAGHKKCTLLVAEDRKDRVAKLRKDAHAEKLERIAERKARFQRTAQGDERKKCQPAKRPKAKAQKHQPQPWHKTCNLLTAENRTKRVAKLREDAQAKKLARITERKDRSAKISAGQKVGVK
jgi:serine/threonine protein kinase